MEKGTQNKEHSWNEVEEEERTNRESRQIEAQRADRPLPTTRGALLRRASTRPLHTPTKGVPTTSKPAVLGPF